MPALCSITKTGGGRIWRFPGGVSFGFIGLRLVAAYALRRLRNEYKA